MASFSPVLEETIHRALTYASDRKHELATLEHLLLALLDDKDAAAVIKACDVDIESLRTDITQYLDDDPRKPCGILPARAGYDAL